MERILEFKNIVKGFNSLQVLAGTSFHLNRGEIVCLLGPSGSGKTTLFKIAAGLITPDSGEIQINSGIRQGYIFQEPRLLPWKTVEQNLTFVQQNYLSGDRAELIRDKLLEFTGLADFKHNYPVQLSGGMKQRLEIIRALSIQPELLLMDEPFKSVDTQTKVNLQQMILRFWERKNLSILLITHDPEEAVLMADRIYVLSQKPGKIVNKFSIDKPQYKRSLKDTEIYGVMEEIVDLFMDLVDEYRWKRNNKTKDIIKQMEKD